MNEESLRQKLEVERVEAEQQRRGFMRWIILLSANLNRPVQSTDQFLLGVVRAEYADATEMQIRRELDYLQSRELLAMTADPASGRVRVSLTRYGIDVAEYTVDVEPGILRPPRI